MKNLRQNHQLINQSSGSVEYYSDPNLVAAARAVMGSIDLDPASCQFANDNFIGAKRFFSKNQDGLGREWIGNVWLNHPFGKAEYPCRRDCTKKICRKRGHHCLEYKPGSADWINYLMKQYLYCNTEQFCCLTFAATSEGWFRPLTAFPQCFLSPRTNYYGPDGKLVRGVSKGSVVTYGGGNVEGFKEHFGKFGWIK